MSILSTTLCKINEFEKQSSSGLLVFNLILTLGDNILDLMDYLTKLNHNNIGLDVNIENTEKSAEYSIIAEKRDTREKFKIAKFRVVGMGIISEIEVDLGVSIYTNKNILETIENNRYRILNGFAINGLAYGIERKSNSLVYKTFKAPENMQHMLVSIVDTKITREKAETFSSNYNKAKKLLSESTLSYRQSKDFEKQKKFLECTEKRNKEQKEYIIKELVKLDKELIDINDKISKVKQKQVEYEKDIRCKSHAMNEFIGNYIIKDKNGEYTLNLQADKSHYKEVIRMVPVEHEEVYYREPLLYEDIDDEEDLREVITITKMEETTVNEYMEDKRFLDSKRLLSNYKESKKELDKNNKRLSDLCKRQHEIIERRVRLNI